MIVNTAKIFKETSHKPSISLNFIHRFTNSFWTLNTTGWLLYAFIIYFNFFSFQDVFKYDIIRLFIITTWGFILSTVMRYIYKKSIKVESQSIILITLITLVCSTVFANIWFWISRTIYYTILGRGLTWVSQLIPGTYQYIIFWDSVLLVGWSSLYISIKFWIAWNQQKNQLQEAIKLTEEAQLQMLRYQLNPHFLFNSLNSIRALISEDKANAKLMVTELSAFLRYSLISKNYPEVSLGQEIEAIQQYFAIEKRRYEDKLEVTYDIDPMAEDYPIISFVIQPLAENAIKYGMRTSPIPLKINISAKVFNGILTVDVANTGTWIDTPVVENEDKFTLEGGIKNVKKRLAMAYPEQYEFQIDKAADAIHVKFIINKA